MEMWTGRTSCFAHSTNNLTLADHFAKFHVDARKVQERTVEPHAVVDHHKIAFKSERSRC